MDHLVSPDPSISVITVTYNSAHDLERAWQGFDVSAAEWIVVDNSSTDNSVEVATKLGAKVVPAGGNLGFSAGNNIGAEQARGDVLVFCNPDIQVTRDGLSRLAARAVSTGGVIAPQLINDDGSLQENGRGIPYPHRKLTHMVAHRPAETDPYLFFAQPGTSVDVVWAMGAAIAVTRETFEHIGRWNDRYFIYYEDAEFCLRALRRGHRVVVDGSTQWRHGWARATARGFSWFAWKNEFKSAMRFYATNFYCVIPLGKTAKHLRFIERTSKRTA